MILASTRHALIACRYLVEAYYEDRYVTAAEIAVRYNMNVRTLMPVLTCLAHTDILLDRVVGGESSFILCCDPQKIRLIDVITALEGRQQFVCCREVIAGIRCDCKTENECAIYHLMNHTMLTAMVKLIKMSLADYCNTNREEV